MKPKPKAAAWPADAVVRKPLDWFKPFSRNPKKHSPEQVQQLRAAMNRWGWTYPILADADGEIIAGHGRLLAAQLDPPLPEAPTMIATGWSDADKRAYRIADNRLAELGEWHEENLRTEMKGLHVAGFDLELTGFALPDVKLMIGIAEPVALPTIPGGDKSPFEQITFTLHTSQVKDVRAAMKAADGMGSYGGSPNDNKNGNAIARVAREFLKQKKPAKAKAKKKGK